MYTMIVRQKMFAVRKVSEEHIALKPFSTSPVSYRNIAYLFFKH